MAKGILIFSVLMSFFMIGCESRTGDKPDLIFTAHRTVLYNRGENINYANITVNLVDGTQSYMTNQRINIEYDHNIGFLAGDGNVNFITTNSEGIATGVFKIVKQDFVGEILVKARMNRFKDVSSNLIFQVRDIPQIEYFEADNYNLKEGINSSTEIRVKLTSESSFVENLQISFNTDLGNLTSSNVSTDNQGVARNTFFISGGVSGTANITARLDLFPSVSESIQIFIQ